MPPAIVSISAKSGTGKTTLLVKLIAELKKRGYAVGAIKHNAHDFNIDYEGKDSWRLTRAGADTMMITCRERMAIVKRHADSQEPPVKDSIHSYFGDMDIVLTEGFKKNDFPKIEVHRRECGTRLLYRDDSYDPTLIAVASDSPLQVDVPVFDLDDATAICDFIENRFLKP